MLMLLVYLFLMAVCTAGAVGWWGGGDLFGRFVATSCAVGAAFYLTLAIYQIGAMS